MKDVIVYNVVEYSYNNILGGYNIIFNNSRRNSNQIYMSNRDLLSAYKEQLKDLTEEKQDLIKLADEKDARIKKLLIQLEQANADVENLGKRIAEVEAKAKKKDKIKKIINQKIDEVLEKKDEIVVDNDEEV